jgi:hypothetical protein
MRNGINGPVAQTEAVSEEVKKTEKVTATPFSATVTLL